MSKKFANIRCVFTKNSNNQDHGKNAMQSWLENPNMGKTSVRKNQLKLENDDGQLLQKSITSFVKIDDDDNIFGAAVKHVRKPIRLFSDVERTSNETNQTKRRKRESSIIYLNYDDIDQFISLFSFHKSALPEDISNELLEYFINDTNVYRKNIFYIDGKKCQTDHYQSYYSKKDKKYSYLGKSHVNKFNDLLYRAEKLIAKTVNEEISKRRFLYYQNRKKWDGNALVVNRYETKAETTGWHSDKLTYIGPQGIIASYSLGATRQFCIRDYMKVGDLQTTYSIGLPHNSLFIMHAGFQEKYQHAIKSNENNSSNFQPHKRLGELRINLTFRDHIFDEDTIKKCDMCGSTMDLRVITKGKRIGNYIWICSHNASGGDCKRIISAEFTKNSSKLELLK